MWLLLALMCFGNGWGSEGEVHMNNPPPLSHFDWTDGALRDVASPLWNVGCFNAPPWTWVLDCTAQASFNQVLFAFGTRVRVNLCCHGGSGVLTFPVSHVLGPGRNYPTWSWRTPAVPLCTDEIARSTALRPVRSVLVATGSARSFCVTGFEQMTNYKNVGATEAPLAKILLALLNEEKAAGGEEAGSGWPKPDSLAGGRVLAWSPSAKSSSQQKLAEVELNTPEEDPSSFLLLTLTPIYSVCKKRSIPVPKGEDLDLKFFVWTQPAGELNVVAMTFSVCACMLLSCVCVCVCLFLVFVIRPWDSWVFERRPPGWEGQKRGCQASAQSHGWFKQFLGCCRGYRLLVLLWNFHRCWLKDGIFTQSGSSK